MPISTATGSLAMVVGGKAFRAINLAMRDSVMAEAISIGYARMTQIGGPAGYNSDVSFGRGLATGVEKNTTDGSPLSNAPSLRMVYPGMWRFRWSVRAGQRSVYVNAKQTFNTSNDRPSLIIKANPDVGLSTDVILTAADSSDWVTIGPATFTATATGMVWVELWNNCQISDCPASFDHIVTT